MSLDRDADAPETGDNDDELFDAADEGDDADGDGEEDVDGEDTDGEADDEGDEGEEDRRGPSKIEKLAMDAGWKPKDKWKGDGWVNAEAFLKNAAKRASTAQREARDVRERMDRLEQAEIKSRERAFKAIDAKAKEMKREAISKGGKDAAQIVEDIEAVAEEEKQKLRDAEPKPVQLSALDRQFFNENSWIVDEHDEEDDDAEAEEAFQLVARTIVAAAKAGKTEIEAYEQAEKAVRKAFPHRYAKDDDRGGKGGKSDKKPARRAPDVADGRGRRMSDDDDAGGKNLAAKLPPEAKRAAAEYVKRGTYGSIEEYAEVYFDEIKKDRR